MFFGEYQTLRENIMKEILKLSLVLLLIFTTSFVLAQEQGIITGKVRDAENGAPLPFVNVLVAGTRFGSATDEAGRFRISVPPGDYTVVVSCLSYRKVSLSNISVQAGASTELQIALDRQPIVVEEVVVTAGEELACPYAEMSNQVIHQNCCCRDVGGLFRQIPGASAVRRGGTALDPVFRGSQGDQLNVTIDGGMHVNGACPNRMDPPAFHVDAEDLEKVEIVKGPYTVRLGPTLGGVVNFVMAKPQRFAKFEIHGKAEVTYESAYQGRNGRLSLLGGNEGYDFNLTAGAKNYRDYRDGNGTEVSSAFRAIHYAAKFGFNPSVNHRIQLSHRQSFARDLMYPALPMDADKDDTQMYAIDYLGGGFLQWLESIAAKVYFSRVDHVMSNTRRPNYQMLHAITDVNTTTLGGRFEGRVRIHSSQLSLGVDYFDLNKYGMRTRDMLTGPMAGKHFDDIVWPDAEMNNLGVFAELRNPLSASIFLTFGARLDYGQSQARHPDTSFVKVASSELSKDEVTWSGDVHFLYRFSEHLESGITIGRGVRFPNITERYIYLLPVGLDRYDYLGNPGLKPEENWQGEVRMKGEHGLVSVEFSAFYSRLTNYISARLESGVTQRSPDVLGVKRFDNINRASKFGGEVQAKVKVSSTLSVEGTMFYTRGQNEDTREPLPDIPPLESQLRIRYEVFDGRGWVQLMGRWVAEQNRISKDFGEQPTPGFALLNLRAGMHFARFIEVAIGVENLLDKAYYEHLNRKRRTDMMPIYEPGRNVVLQVNLEY